MLGGGCYADMPARGCGPQVDTQPGEVIKPDSWKCIDGEGMPIENHPFDKGNLYLQFTVRFPETLNQQEVAAIKQVMGVPGHSHGSSRKCCLAFGLPEVFRVVSSQDMLHRCMRVLRYTVAR